VSNDLSKETLVGFWRDMHRIRAFERAAAYQSTLGKIYGALHSYEGQEACAVGVRAALRTDDYVASTHRGHGHCLAKGTRMDRMMAELFGRENGYCRGKGGSLHIADFGSGMLGANGIVGAGYAIAAGAALTAKRSGSGRVAVCFFGDGAVTRGTFHEVMNMASLWKLPLLMVCENNGYAQYVATTETMVFRSVAELAANYRMPGVHVDGNDMRGLHGATAEAVARARSGEGPTLLEFKTQRFTGHSSGAPQSYRSKAEVDELRRSRDPVIAEIMYSDFLAVCTDEIVNQAAKIRYMTGGQARVPLVIRSPIGMTRGVAAQHSQSLEAWFAHIPGLRVAMPSTPADAKGLLKTALRGEDPVIFFEQKLLYGAKGPVPEGSDHLVPLGKAVAARDGEDVTVVATGLMVSKALEATVELERSGISVELIDPRTVSPVDFETIYRSVDKTARALVLTEATLACSVASEIAASIAEHRFNSLDGPARRLGSPFVPKPSTPVLEKLAYLATEDIVRIVREMVPRRGR